MSAAVLSREIQTRLQLAEKWRSAAADGDMEGETYRAGLALQIFNLLLGDRKALPEISMHWWPGPPRNGDMAAEFLRDWTTVWITGITTLPPACVEPYPLFSGPDWSKAGPLTTKHPARRLRRPVPGAKDWCNPKTADDLSVDHLAGYADLAALWELPKFLREIEAVLKQRDPERYLQFTVGRVLGNSGFRA